MTIHQVGRRARVLVPLRRASAPTLAHALEVELLHQSTDPLRRDPPARFLGSSWMRGRPYVPFERMCDTLSSVSALHHDASTPEHIEIVVADKGYFKVEEIALLRELNIVPMTARQLRPVPPSAGGFPALHCARCIDPAAALRSD